MPSTKHHSQRYAAFLAAALVITGGALAASSATASYDPAGAAALAAGAPTSRLQDGTQPAAGACRLNCGPPVIQATWQYDGDGLGTVTVHGHGFTPGDTVRVTLNMPHSLYDQWVTASRLSVVCPPGGVCTPIPGGNFTVTQSGIACGVNPETNSDGQDLIDALDQQSGADAVDGIQSPCPEPWRLLVAS